LRGYQKTNHQGECRFKAIFPGWYSGRLTHVHAKVHVNNKVVLTTNFFFSQDIEHEVHSSSLYPKGINPTPRTGDFELKDDKDNARRDSLVMKVTKDGKGHLLGTYTIAVG